MCVCLFCLSIPCFFRFSPVFPCDSVSSSDSPPEDQHQRLVERLMDRFQIQPTEDDFPHRTWKYEMRDSFQELKREAMQMRHKERERRRQEMQELVAKLLAQGFDDWSCPDPDDTTFPFSSFPSPESSSPPPPPPPGSAGLWVGFTVRILDRASHESPHRIVRKRSRWPRSVESE